MLNCAIPPSLTIGFDINATVKCFWELIRIGIIPDPISVVEPSIELTGNISQKSAIEVPKCTDDLYEIFWDGILGGYRNIKDGKILYPPTFVELSAFSNGFAIST